MFRIELKARGSSRSASADHGMALKGAVRTPHFWIIGVAFLLFSTSISGFIPSYIPMLTDGGMTREAAAAMAAFIGISVILGRFIIGFLLDYLPPARLSAMLMVLPAIGCLVWGLGVAGSSGISPCSTIAARWRRCTTSCCADPPEGLG